MDQATSEQNDIICLSLEESSGSSSSTTEEAKLAQNPVITVQQLLGKKPVSLSPSSITDERLDSYTMAVVTAIRDSNIPQLEALKAQGASFDACNRNAESLWHLACRRSTLPVIEWLLSLPLAPTVVDSLGRTVLHDVCWRSEPDTALLGLLLNDDDRMGRLLLVSDQRGHTPLDYARREHWPIWNEFLRQQFSQ